MPRLKDQHQHSYIRLKKSKEIYICSDAFCHSRISRLYLRGKASLCPECLTNTLILSSADLRLARPICEACRSKKTGLIAELNGILKPQQKKEEQTNDERTESELV